MHIRKLLNQGDGSYGVALPKKEMEYDGLLEGGEPVADDQQMIIEREGPLEWTVRAVSDGADPETH